ncbi:carboxymuconolactone decarboxylase family protein [Aquimarina agarilytica]|uniref:carboxymuconolactone decarboxylase family protein n=1 Tax=Aquimarina agarilytica TaxID=1087449 RepID=UPI000289A4C6|nr:carboxymuconolactone decarboxylase family protein [Aquimarina agarilytica]
MLELTIPKREEVSSANQAIFDNLEKAVGFVPNIYAAMAHSENGLGNYLQYSGAKTSFSNKEKEVIDLAVSQVNGCKYCLAAHTAIGKMNGFNDDQIIGFRQGNAEDTKLNALAKLAQSIAINKGKASDAEVAAFYEAGYNKENLVDLVLAIGIITTTNFFHNLTGVAIDFPETKEL